MKFSNSLPVLVLANLMPLIGVTFLGWDIFQIIILYWLETLVIGGFTVAKILNSGKPVVDASAIETVIDPKSGMVGYELKSNGDYVSEFTGKFIVFLGIQLLFIGLIFLPGMRSDHHFSQVITDTKQFIPAFLALIVSHGYSYFTNYLGKKEFLAYSPKEIILQAFSRIILMDIAVIVGMALAVEFNYDTSIVVLLILVLLKIIFDLTAHIFERIRGHEGIEKSVENFVYDTFEQA